MRLCYQVATPEVAVNPNVTACQGDIDVSFKKVSFYNYQGVELMVRNPVEIDLKHIQNLSEKYSLPISMVCTGEIFGQDRLSFTDENEDVRLEAVKRMKDSIDLAYELDAQVNIGRLRGGYVYGIEREISYKRALNAFLEVTEYAAKKDVVIALEPVNTLALNFINTTDEGIEMVKKISSRHFRLMLDTAHMFIEDKDMNSSIKASKEYISYVHLVDSNRKYPGNCKIDFYSFIQCLKDLDYHGYLSIEVFQIPDENTALEKSAQHILPMIS